VHRNLRYSSQEGENMNGIRVGRKCCGLAGVALLTAIFGLATAGTASADITAATIDNATLGAGRQTVTVTGTITCTENEFWNLNGIQLIQGQKIVARGPAVAEGDTCTGQPQPYTAVASIQDEKLVHKGRTSVQINFSGPSAGFFVDGFVNL
jgi:hypothetical protein